MAKNLIKQKKKSNTKINILLTVKMLLSLVLTFFVIIGTIAGLMVLQDAGYPTYASYIAIGGCVLVLFLIFWGLEKIFTYLINK